MYLFKLKKHTKCQKKICIENNCDLVALKIVVRVKSLDIIKNKRTNRGIYETFFSIDLKQTQ
jgi:hypothetical protein